MRQLYLAATGQNRGKTTAALGLFDGFVRRGLHAGFMKPVGQRTVIDDGEPADEDAVLMRTTFGLPEPYSVAEPGPHPARLHEGVHRGRGRRGPRREDPPRARARSRDHDVLLIEGTGHAGVGAVIGLSNAVVAASLGAPAIIVSEGGVGRPIDEIVLNASLFARHGVPVAGRDREQGRRRRPARASQRVLERGLAPYGIPLLGVLPVRPILSNPTLEMILEGVRARRSMPGPDLDRVIDGVAIGAMEPGHMLERVGPKTLVIVPGRPRGRDPHADDGAPDGLAAHGDDGGADARRRSASTTATPARRSGSC